MAFQTSPSGIRISTEELLSNADGTDQGLAKLATWWLKGSYVFDRSANLWFCLLGTERKAVAPSEPIAELYGLACLLAEQGAFRSAVVLGNLDSCRTILRFACVGDGGLAVGESKPRRGRR